jgi:uncharacterized membrane protein YdjX (TVP38/TMEM64 family)
VSRRLAVGLAVLAALGVGAWWWDVPRYLDVGPLRTLVASHGPWGPLVFVAAFIGGVLLHLPGIPLVALGALLFEMRDAFVYAWVAIVLSTTATFFLVRWFFRETVQRTLAARFPGLRRLDERLVESGFATVLVLRLLFFMAPPLNFAMGATRVRFAAYLGGTAVGVLPGVGLAVAFAETIVTGDGGAHAFTPARAAAAVTLLAFAGVGAWLARRHLFAAPSTDPGPER